MIGRVIVMKFGGTSVGDAPSIRAVVEIVRQQLPQRPVVVVSAHAGVTDALLDLALSAPAGAADTGAIAARHRDVLRDLGLPTDLLDPWLRELDDLARGLRLVGEASPRAVDAIASFGERCSARTVAAALRAAAIPATAVDAFAAGLRTDSAYGRARPLPDDGRIARAIGAVEGVPVVTGFIGADEQGHITTLGRNGSDYSAALIGAAIGALEIQVWKDVDGVRTADPRLVPASRPIRRMSFDEVCELASFGSKVLHPAAMVPAMQRRIPIAVRNTREPAAPGTRIEAALAPDAPAVRAIAHRRRVAVLTIGSQHLVPQHVFLARVFAALAARGDDADFVAVSEGAVTLVLDQEPAGPHRAQLQTAGEIVECAHAALVGVVGAPAALRAGTAAVALEALAEAGIAARWAGLGAHGSTLAAVVAEADVDRAVRLLHQRFFG